MEDIGLLTDAVDIHTGGIVKGKSQSMRLQPE